MPINSHLNKCGIYKIKNRINNKYYIGSSINVRKRWKAHRNNLRHNKHVNRYLQSAVNKYGLNNFSCEIQEVVVCEKGSGEIKNILIGREQYWIDVLKACDRNFGYNLSPTAGMVLGIKHTIEARKRMSDSHLGNHHTKESKQKISDAQYKKVYQICKNTGKVIKIFLSVLDASKETGIQKTGISMCCRNVIKQSGGFFWTYDPSTFVKPELKRKVIERPWKQKAVSDGIKEWPKISAMCKELNLTWQQVHGRLLKGDFFYV
jgi:hypothetical protein